MIRPTLQLLALSLPLVHGFSFSYTKPTQCDPLTITWEGGKPPFQLQLTPTFNNPRRFNILESAWNGTHGSFTTPLQVNITESPRFIITMSDADGFASGGNSPLLKIGTSVLGNTCDITTPPNDFTFSTPILMQQCREFAFTDFPANRQITITGIIPLGQAFSFQPRLGLSSFSVPMNIRAGTQMIFFMVDSSGASGGCTDSLTVGNSDDSSCINSQSPSSTADEDDNQTSAVPQTSTNNPTGTGQPATSSATTGPGGSNTAVIGGSIAGGIIALVAVVTMAVFLWRLHRRRTAHSFNAGRRRGSSRRIRSVDLAETPGAPQYRNHFEPTPFSLPPPTAFPPSATSSNPFDSYNSPSHPSWQTQPNWQDHPAGHGDYQSHHGEYQSHPLASPLDSQHSYSAALSPAPLSAVSEGPRGHHPRTASMATSLLTPAAGMSKAAMMAASSHNMPTRFVLHTDAGSAEMDGDDDDEVVELPPTYTALSSRTKPAAVPVPPSPTESTGLPYRNSDRASSSSSIPPAAPQLPPLSYGE